VNTMKEVKKLSEIPYSIFQVKRNEHNRRTNTKGQHTQLECGNFPLNVVNHIGELYLKDCRQVVDPFSGWGERHAGLAKLGIPYYGFDLSKVANEYARKVLGVYNHYGDSRKVFVPRHDGLITCPPYYNVEKYANPKGLDKLDSWESFLLDYEYILSRFALKAEQGAVYCIITGNWRSKGKYYELTYNTEKIMEKLGFVKHDMVILSRKGHFNPCIQLPQCKKFKRSVKVHETLNVWIKS